MGKEDTKLSLGAKLARIGKEIGKVDKTGKNQQQRYDYIEYGVVAGRIRELFDEYRVIIIPSVVEYSQDNITTRNGGVGYHYTLKMRFQIINGDDPQDTISADWMGESADYGDKGINKAETSGTKYFLMRLFNVSEKGEEEADAKTPKFDKSEPNPKKTPKTSVRDISYAVSALEQCKTMDDLKKTYAVFTYDLKIHPDVVAKKDELKAKFATEGVVVTADRGGDNESEE